jgi:hypothetical protein
MGNPRGAAVSPCFKIETIRFDLSSHDHPTPQQIDPNADVAARRTVLVEPAGNLIWSLSSFTTFMLIADRVALIHQHHEKFSYRHARNRAHATQRSTSAVAPVGAHDNNNKPIRVRWQIEDAGGGRSAVLEPTQD